MIEDQLDHPFDEVIKSADEVIKQGATVFQKFTCSNCKSRLTIEDPNKFHKKGRCQMCDAITDIEKQGCNYLAIFGSAR